MEDLSYENYVHVESAQNSCNALATFFYGTDDSKYQNFEKAMELAKRICLGDVPIWAVVTVLLCYIPKWGIWILL